MIETPEQYKVRLAAYVEGKDPIAIQRQTPHILAQLIEGIPLFPPVEGLDETLWKKTCTTCHKWDKARLCEQGKTYVKDPKYILRVPHPYGGPFKLALLRWAKSGCE